MCRSRSQVRLWISKRTDGSNFNRRLDRALNIRDDIYVIENEEIGLINYAMERLRLRERRLQLDGEESPETTTEIAARRQELNAEYGVLQRKLIALYETVNRGLGDFSCSQRAGNRDCLRRYCAGL